MSLAALKDTVDLLTRVPVLWIPGFVCGILAACLWLVLNISGAFLAGRLLVIFPLVCLFFIIGMLSAVHKRGATFKEMLADGTGYYFRVLLPTLVIVFGIVLVFIMVILTLTLFGLKPDAGLLTFLVFGVVLPTVILTLFYDTAVIFEGKKVFESLERSIEVVTANLGDVILFMSGCLLIFCSISFGMMVLWTSFLADRLEPISRFNETQLQSFTSDQFIVMIGQDGIWITALVIFCYMTLLIPVLYTYKACFYRLVSGKIAQVQQQVGEFDSKGRWYKY
ncbi:MAG: hypothetical protein OS112_07820 [Methanoregula sp.]|nr:MAG: hypothetical protein OS112_07820 [Methanoregula sp.]